jgi:hypothetical protein
MPPTPPGWDQYVLAQMLRKAPQNWMRLALHIHRLAQVGVQAPEGHGDGSDALLRAILAAPGVLAQELAKLVASRPSEALNSPPLFIGKAPTLDFGLWTLGSVFSSEHFSVSPRGLVASSPCSPSPPPPGFSFPPTDHRPPTTDY